MRRILLVDDNETFRRSLREVLQQAGYEAQAAEEGAAALKLYRQQPFDLVITDLLMPGKEGLETIMELRRLQPELKVVAISGGGRIDANDYLPMAKKLGATETLAKPFTSEQILGVVAGLLDEGK
jgi:CheY-like chemotaxis protein